MVDTHTLVTVAKTTAKMKGINPALVCAVIEQESAWYPFAVRYEPAFFAKYIHPAHPETPSTEDMNRAQSFGLLQLMGQSARELGFNGKSLCELCDPVTGIEWGCRKLAACIKAENGNFAAALLRWNGGGNKAYPDQVLARMSKYQDPQAVTA